MAIRRITILGVGLLGGSIGLAAHRYVKGCVVRGYGHRRATLDAAVRQGAIDLAHDNARDACQDADLVILCTPVGLFEPLLRDIAGHIPPGAIVTDVGSTKRSVVRLAAEYLPDTVRFVGSHPMAGSEKRGVEFARADLFQNALCLVTPVARSDAEAVIAVEGFWRSLGMRTSQLSPESHDRLLADVSHLPHVLAAALVAMQSEASLRLAGGGFLDTTRIASGDGSLWRDILIDNADNLHLSIQQIKARLDQFASLLTRPDALAAWLNESAHRRDALLREKQRPESTEA